MIKWKNICIAASLSAVLLVPTIALANETYDLGHFHRDRGGDQMRVKHASIMLDRIHRQTYFTLLSEKYTPESTKQWREVFAERERLIKEMKSLQNGAEKTGQISRTEEEQQEHQQEHREEMKMRHTEKMALYEEFTEAVRSQDQLKIKAVMPKMLEQSRQMNKQFAERIAAMKKK
ncbi:hypothetical protein ACQCN2_19195 [Brevibacillus ginsengisoli]|uniref:hypothetical protein n=1 Tax=Brevibacillus ginsengisoli TaxID=363854 RepID=UPI003CEAA929